MRGNTSHALARRVPCRRVAWLVLFLATVCCLPPPALGKGGNKASTPPRSSAQDAASAPPSGNGEESVAAVLARVGVAADWAAKLAAAGVTSKGDLAALSEEELLDSVRAVAGVVAVRAKLVAALWRAKFDVGSRLALPSLDESLTLEGLQHVAAGRLTAALDVLALPVGYIPALLALHTLLARAPLVAPEADKDALLSMAAATMAALPRDRQDELASFYTRAISWVEDRNLRAPAGPASGQGAAAVAGVLHAWLAELWYQRGLFLEHVVAYHAGGGHRGGGDDEAVVLRPRNKTSAGMAAVAEGRGPQLRQQGEVGLAHGGARWLQLAAGAGHAGAMYELALWYESRTWENKTADRARAGQLMHQAASLGLPAAKFSVGVGLLQGDGVVLCNGTLSAEPNVCPWLEGGASDEAARVAHGARLVREAAEGGQADAQVMVGEWCRDGARENQGVTDVSAALAWFRHAALQRHPEAMYSVADAAITGAGMPVNMEAARFWMRQAARKGHASAMRMVERY